MNDHDHSHNAKKTIHTLEDGDVVGQMKAADFGVSNDQDVISHEQLLAGVAKIEDENTRKQMELLAEYMKLSGAEAVLTLCTKMHPTKGLSLKASAIGYDRRQTTFLNNLSETVDQLSRLGVICECGKAHGIQRAEEVIQNLKDGIIFGDDEDAEAHREDPEGLEDMPHEGEA